jgi:hypothetical protein
MGAHIEWIKPDVGILRAGVEFDAYGDPFDFVATIDIDGDRVTIKGALSRHDADRAAYHFGLRRFLKNELKAKGVWRVRWERIKGTPIPRSIEINLA